jgi:hypothetical protein
MKTSRWIAISFGAVTLAFGLFWWLEVRAFSELTSCAQISWRRPDHFPWIRGSKWWPFGTIEGFSLQKPPTDPASYSAALRRIKSIDRMMVYSFGEVDPRIWDTFGDIEIQRLLDLNYTSVDDDAFASFVRASSVDHLILFDTLVSTTALQSLSRFPNLERISIQGTPVTPEVVGELAKLPSLKQVNLLGECSREVNEALLDLERTRTGLMLDWERHKP